MIEDKSNFKRQSIPATVGKTYHPNYIPKGSDKLTVKEELFIRNICVYPPDDAFDNCTEAARKAGYKNSSSLKVTAWELLNKPKIQRAVDKYRKRIMREFDIAPKKILQEIAATAFSNFQDFYSDDGTLLNIKDLRRECGAALQGVDIKFGLGQDGSPEVVQKIKLYDKIKSLEMLGRYHGMWTDKFEINPGDNLLQGDERAKQIREKLLAELPPIETDGE